MTRPLRPAWRPRPADLPWLAAAALLAAAVLLYALVRCLGDLIMTRPVLRLALVAAAAVAALGMAGCGTLGGSRAGQQILDNLQGCDRHYEGAIGAGVNGSFRIDCKAQAAAPAALAPVPADEEPPLAVAPSNPS